MTAHVMQVVVPEHPEHPLLNDLVCTSIVLVRVCFLIVEVLAEAVVSCSNEGTHDRAYPVDPTEKWAWLKLAAATQGPKDRAGFKLPPV
ncbi:hypothetical protein KCU65_g35, partial [Aureobasidium melanogenum]